MVRIILQQQSLDLLKGRERDLSQRSASGLTPLLHLSRGSLKKVGSDYHLPRAAS